MNHVPEHRRHSLYVPGMLRRPQLQARQQVADGANQLLVQRQQLGLEVCGGFAGEGWALGTEDQGSQASPPQPPEQAGGDGTAQVALVRGPAHFPQRLHGNSAVGFPCPCPNHMDWSAGAYLWCHPRPLCTAVAHARAGCRPQPVGCRAGGSKLQHFIPGTACFWGVMAGNSATPLPRACNLQL